MKVYVAAPFFNHVQLGIVMQIEALLARLGVEFYSPRLHSGSDKLTPQEKKVYANWESVLDSNINNINTCDLMIAVLEYAMPHGHKLVPIQITEDGYTIPPISHVRLASVELPDNGVVFECGYAMCALTPVIGYHSTKHLPEMNLMLTHTIEGMCVGMEMLETFLKANLDYPGGQADEEEYWNFGMLEQPTSEVI